MANEKRLIDAKAGKKVFSAIAQPAEYKGVIRMVVPISEIDKLPTVDAVSVVRCRDCKHAVEIEKDHLRKVFIDGTKQCELGRGYPLFSYSIATKDGFCDSGERKDGDGNG